MIETERQTEEKVVNNLTELEDELEDLRNVNDDEEDIVTTSNLFSISSFGVDYPVEVLVSRMNKELFYVPGFQRQFIWSQNQASRFVESLLLGLPVPGIFLFQESETGKHLVIDGQQRLKSLQFFFNRIFNSKEFQLRGLGSDWNGKTFETLNDDDQARLSDAVIHATVFKQDLPKDQMNSVYEVFERINTGGMKLSAQEIRSCICHGNFNTFLHTLNENKEWREIYGPKSKRLKDVETILRFLAFYESYEKYSNPMKHFLNNYMEEKRNYSDKQLKPLAEVFSSTMKFVVSSLGNRPFRPERALNVAVFDSVATSIAHMLKNETPLDKEKTKLAYQKLFENEEFKRGYLLSTADLENVKRRFRVARSAFRVE